jgi:hypothetical protein
MIKVMEVLSPEEELEEVSEELEEEPQPTRVAHIIAPTMSNATNFLIFIFHSPSINFGTLFVQYSILVACSAACWKKKARRKAAEE